jgi:hypothetical protein
MKKAIQKSAITFLAVMLIMATGGFSVYHHFCRCEGESTASVFIDAVCDHDCASVAETATCCAETPKHSCCAIADIDAPAKSHHHDDCCNSSSEFYKIFDTFRVNVEKISLKFIAGIIQVLTGIDFIREPLAARITGPEPNDTSPPLYGTELLHSIHQLKLDQPLV